MPKSAAAEQIGYWAALGRQVARVLNPDSLLDVAPEQVFAALDADVLARIAYADAPEAHRYDALSRAKALGYQVIMVMIHLESPALNQARISERVSEGGHDVLADKVVSRIPRLLHHVRTSLSLCDVARAYDNISADHPFISVLTVRHGRLERHVTPRPDWADGLLAVF
ncbi:hypothetical protein KBZ12_17210 [Cyanobium sp. Cruz CV13-4-11]|jgi:hypothetical protein|uniref:hypothetical protein n=1 Tax=unclassified Cyanobium TaxID=2627006 RepID=UPI0020CE8F7C|nr:MULTISPECIES: hypothetical protein [unclassified Cyanobium]MCP9902313.1 hypothetical protein [Cyanobium sp. Cruz CV11-17]MCP9921183.1 hypothetical protein [Cyanobium sp. Cruz CV13-4-11]